MNEEESWREQRMQELQARTAEKQHEAENQARMEHQLQSVLRGICTPEALERLANVKLVNYEKYLQVSQALVLGSRQGKIVGKVTEEQLKAMLGQLSQKKGITITRKGKLGDMT